LHQNITTVPIHHSQALNCQLITFAETNPHYYCKFFINPIQFFPPAMSQQVSNREATQERPVIARRRKSIESFKSDKAIRAIQRQIGKEGLNLDVRDFYQTNTATCAHTQQVVYMGIAIAESDHDANELVIGVTTHDGTYSIGYESHHYPPKQGFNLGEVSVALDNGSGADVSMAEDDQAPQSPSSQINLVDYVINMVNDHRLNNHYKIAGGAITKQAAALCPELASALWRELDIVCFIFKPFGDEDEACEGTEEKVDEESDSVARKAIE
jgi:hypothetical protein